MTLLRGHDDREELVEVRRPQPRHLHKTPKSETKHETPRDTKSTTYGVPPSHGRESSCVTPRVAPRRDVVERARSRRVQQRVEEPERAHARGGELDLVLHDATGLN